MLEPEPFTLFRFNIERQNSISPLGQQPRSDLQSYLKKCICFFILAWKSRWLICVEWLHSKAFGGPQQTPANVPLSEHHSLVGPPLSLTQRVQWPWLTHCIQPTNRWAALSTGTRRPATLLLSLAALQQFRQHTGELLTLVNALRSPSSLQLLRFLVCLVVDKVLDLHKHAKTL